MNSLIMPPATIGIIGGGQLGRMMAVAAKQMGFRVAVLDPDAEGPAAQLADTMIAANYSDLEAAKQLADVSDRITYEFENIDRDVLGWLEGTGKLVQSPLLLELTQHRIKEKQAIEESGCQVAPYRSVTDNATLQQAIAELGLPAVLKTCTGGYDGKGQVVLKTEEDATEAQALLQQGDCVLEQWVPFKAELSVIVVSSANGEVRTFPVAENRHEQNILAITTVPARFSESVLQQADELALKLAEALPLVGTLAVEMFLTQDDELYVNELAPRPHNSGHYTIEGCETSQFEQHVRAVCGWPLGATTLRQPSVMVNILGEHLPAVLNQVDSFGPHTHLHLYGKKEARPLRKMGHLTVTAPSVQEAEAEASELDALLYGKDNRGIHS
ncbi:5-(carboxyamino)imidazole ribonucleotide synthase [Aureibacillus halotolerans]|uniref:N5-carboxyaminoimidazole ribonucleotide synthase n=1 Tax=Aureibacillus halotolerans TaxID=1508390 RepID=A0A4R6TSJ1_9BACI|nr:5-(carboxyamino)imidazole ribonucleotide synthase [Aureibacillus halotolerans]TDQ34143.1 5-(carboxyamino)imidazole ribonucleotide synthase [Aureibacillus halotolerans]